MKIAHKLLLSFLTIVLLIWVVGYLGISTGQESLKTQIGESSVLFAAETLKDIGKNIHSKIELFQEYSRNLTLQQTVSESNRKFEKLDNIQAYITKKDQEWTFAPKKTITPFMQQLMSNRLSKGLAEKAKFYEIKRGFKAFGEIFVTNKHGANIAQTGKTTDYRQDDEQWWQKAKTDGVAVSDVEYDESANIYSADIAIRIDDNHGNFMGVIKVVVNVEEVIETVKMAERKIGHQTARLYLMNKQGMAIYGQSHKFLEDLSDHLPFPKIVGDQGYFTAQKTGGNKGKSLYSYAVLKDYNEFKSWGWVLVIEYGTEEIFAPIAQFRKKIFTIALVVTIFALLMSLFISGHISNPIAKLKTATIAVGMGNLDTEIQAESNDEVGQLAGAFNKMVKDLKMTTISIDVLSAEIVEREQAEEALRDSEEKHRTLFESSRDAIMTIAPPTWLFTSGNPATMELFKVRDEAEFISFGPWQLSAERQPDGKPSDEKAKEMIETAMHHGSHFFEWMHCHFDGTPFPAEVLLTRMEQRGQVLLQATVRDITERKQAEETLRERTNELKERVKELSCLHGISKLIEQSQTSVSGIFQGVAELIPSSLQYPKITCARIVMENQTYKTQNFRKTAWKLTNEITVRNQRIGAVELYYLEEKPEMDEGPFLKEEKYLVKVIAQRLGDIYERCQAKEEKKQFETQLLQSEKMASIGQLAAGVAHEINNPTGFVSSNLKTLSDYIKDISGLTEAYRNLIADLKESPAGGGPPDVSEQIKRILALEEEVDIEFVLSDISELIDESREGSERIKKIVQDLKDFAHPGEDKLKFADINKNLDSTVNVVWNELKYKAEVTKDYGDLPEVQCYPQLLNQVFVNILVNAAQSIEERGEIGIKTRADNGYVEIKISDTGSGIPKENLARIFDPFFTTKEVGKGTGLGMNVAWNIIKKHKGTIDVESTVGTGTTFTIRIPVE